MINLVRKFLTLHSKKWSFYSCIPSGSETKESFEYKYNAPYDEIFQALIDAEYLKDELISLIPFARDFDPSHTEKEDSPFRYFFDNSQFSHSDAMALFAYITKLKPANIIEIGSGFSSLLSLDAISFNKKGTLHCIEPYPKPFLKELANSQQLNLHQIRAENLSFEELDNLIVDGDIIFIDSSHVVKTGSDCQHIYLRLLPHIKKKVFIHIHDIFLPQAYPLAWLENKHLYWNEQYIVLAWLINNSKAKIIFGSTYHQLNNIDLLRELSHNRHEELGGSSLWIEYN